MNSIELKTALSLALIYATRMLGLFMILPVFTIYAENLEEVTPLLVGLAIGIYGLTQALLQIPFGAWSDRIGRKPVIIVGLLIFMLGSVVAASADSIYWVIIGRALQGAGAIASAIMALASDLTREQHRTKVMAIIGASIGASFMIALVVGPLLQGWIGVQGIFWMTAVLAMLSISIVALLIPTPVTRINHAALDQATLKTVISDTQLLRLDLGVFTLHMILTAMFVVVPLILRDRFFIQVDMHWQIYLSVMLFSLILLVPVVILSEKYAKTKQAFLFAISLCAASHLFLSTNPSTINAFFIAMLGFFWGFNLLEASMPSLVSKYSNPVSKGLSMGVFSSSQFLGAFFGGVMAGAIVQNYGHNGVFLFAFIMFLLWFLVALSMRNPVGYETLTIDLKDIDRQQRESFVSRCYDLKGVTDVTVISEDQIAYVKTNKKVFQQQQFDQLQLDYRN
jgi:MFS family permease